jgi:transcriptional regulator with XRE-family HTH domain
MNITKLRLVNMEDTIKILVVGLKKYAKMNHINQGTLSDAIGKDQGTISNYFREVTRPSMRTIKILTEFLDVSQDELLDLGREQLTSHKDEIREMIKAELADQVPDRITREHQELVSKFQDKEAGKEANNYLLELEELDPDVFYGMIYQMKKKVQILREKKKTALLKKTAF